MTCLAQLSLGSFLPVHSALVALSGTACANTLCCSHVPHMCSVKAPRALQRLLDWPETLWRSLTCGSLCTAMGQGSTEPVIGPVLIGDTLCSKVRQFLSSGSGKGPGHLNVVMPGM